MESLSFTDIGLIAIFAVIIIGKLIGCKLHYPDQRETWRKEESNIRTNPNHPLNPGYKHQFEDDI